jgi:AcrR family transcriptional regulator
MSPRSSKQFEEMREEKKMLIMDTALEHFANSGYYSTTINHIAKHAGISKGLMYNYFESKEALLKAIINKSVTEIYSYFDTNRDVYLSQDEFEYFVRKINTLLMEKRPFWRLMTQLLMQNEVREQFLKSFAGTDSLLKSGINTGKDLPVSQIMNLIADYFMRKKDKMNADYDPIVDLNMFLIALKGLAITTIYSDDVEYQNNEKIINRIIKLYK